MSAPSYNSSHCLTLLISGFLAVSYSTGAVVVVDMRGPRTIYRSGEHGSKERHRVSIDKLHIGKSSTDIAKALTWSISGLEGGPSVSAPLNVSPI